MPWDFIAFSLFSYHCIFTIFFDSWYFTYFLWFSLSICSLEVTVHWNSPLWGASLAFWLPLTYLLFTLEVLAAYFTWALVEVAPLHCPCVLFPPRQLRLPQRFALIIIYLGLGGSGLLLTYYLGLGGSVPLTYYLPYGLYFRRDGSDVRRLAYYAPLLCLQHPDVPRSCCLV